MNNIIKKISKIIISLLLFVNVMYPIVIINTKAVETNFSTETIKWLEWFNSLSYEEQLTINYRPYEILNYLNDNQELYSELMKLIEIDKENAVPNYMVPNDPGDTKMPTGGYELAYNPSYWNGTRINKANCYYYVMNVVSVSSNKSHHQPGYMAGVSYNLTGTSIISAVKSDVPYFSNIVSFRESSQTEKASVNEYKVALVIAPNKDYHWYMQHQDGNWSHKRGHTEVINTDASGLLISNPKLCDRDYGSVNYSTFVGYYIVKYK